MATHKTFIKESGLPIGNAELQESDVLIIVDMQYDFVPGGAFAVSDGDKIIPSIAAAIMQAHSVGATVIFTRDYHPSDHVSFLTKGGPFPPHCQQGSHGSLIVDELVAASNPDDIVVFKGFLNCVDSFGAAPYSKRYADGRIRKELPCTVRSTGAYALHCSARLVNDQHNLNAPPDLTSWKGPQLNKEESLQTIIRSVPARGKIYVCGLALDYCVIDTAVNLRKYTSNRIFVLENLSRAAAANPGFTEAVLHSTVPEEAARFAGLMTSARIGLATLH